MGEPQKILALALDPPNMSDICRTILSLKQIGALALKSNGIISPVDGDLTFLGKVAANLPLDPHLSKLIVMGFVFGCLRETIIIAAGLSLKSFHARPFQDELNAYLSKVSWAYGSFSDCMAIFNTYTVWETHKERGLFAFKLRDKERQWAKQSYVQIQAMREVDCLIKEIWSRLENSQIKQRIYHNPPRLHQGLILKICIAAAFYPNYFKRNASDDYQQIICRELNGHDPFSTLVMSGLPPETNLLYDKQLRELFHECSQDLSINYDGSKAFVQFSRLKDTHEEASSGHISDMPGEYPTSMHLALKQKQIARNRTRYSLSRFTQDEAKYQMSRILRGESRCNPFELEDPNNINESNLLEQTTKKAQVSVHSTELKNAILPSPAQRTYDVHVIHIEDAAHFWAIPNDKDSIKNLNYVQKMIKICVENGQASPMSISEVKVGDVCIAPYIDIDGNNSLYRAQVIKLVEKEKKQMALIHYVDFGNSCLVAISNLKVLPSSLLHIPKLAVECALCEIKPSLKHGNGDYWSDSATQWIIGRILNKNLTLHIYSIVHNVLRVEVLEKGPYGNLLSLNETMIEYGYAVKAEEFVISRHNHHLRSIYSDEYKISHIVPEQLSRALSCSSLDLKSNSFKKYSGKINLKGPYSPLEMKFVPLTRTECSKSVHIDPNSVNSTILDPEPQNRHDRLIVSAFTVLNPSETGVCLRSTTLMPAIPGILSLCLLLFAPTAELRMNKCETEYIGAIYGLGCTSEGYSLYPEEDIENEFDIEFTENDLITINKIRLLLNIVFEEGEDISSKVLSKTQRKLREFIINLFDEKRPYKEPEPYHKPYRWRTVKLDKILQPNVEGGSDLACHTYPLHYAIDLPDRSSPAFLLSRCKKLHQMERRLLLDKKSLNFEVQTNCILCNDDLKTYGELKDHIKSHSHRKIKKELEELLEKSKEKEE